MMDYSHLTTEKVNPASRGLDEMSTPEILRIINDDFRVIADVVDSALPDIGKAVDLIVEKLSQGGSVLYVGAGTSGRLGILDAVECPPTFGVGQEVFSAVIAGGSGAVFEAVEGAEDDESMGAIDVGQRVECSSVVVGISASGTTPYMLGGLREAKRRKAATVAVVCNQKDKLDLDVDVVIALPVGPEVVAGSTRMKAGSAQKLVLNMLSTASMIRLGKVYDNYMVDMQPTNRKLRDRAIRIVSMAADVTPEKSRRLLDESDWHVKTAIVMALGHVGRLEAEKAIAMAKGHTRQAVKILHP